MVLGKVTVPTSHAITALTEVIRKSLDNNEITAGVFVDLKKAFDTVDHNILISKLYHYGIRGIPLDLIKSYFQNRYHCTKIQNTESNFISQKHGVPQGGGGVPFSVHYFLSYISMTFTKQSNTQILSILPMTQVFFALKSPTKSLSQK